MIRIPVDFDAVSRDGTKIYINTTYHKGLAEKLTPGLRVILFEEGGIQVEADIGHKASSSGIVYWYGEADWTTIGEIENHPAYHNRRQYRHMLRAIEGYEKGVVSLNELIGSLNALLSVLEGISDDWRRYFQGEVGLLDGVLAVIVHSERTSANEDERHQINQAIKNLRTHIESVLAQVST